MPHVQFVAKAYLNKICRRMRLSLRLQYRFDTDDTPATAAKANNHGRRCCAGASKGPFSFEVSFNQTINRVRKGDCNYSYTVTSRSKDDDVYNGTSDAPG